MSRLTIEQTADLMGKAAQMLCAPGDAYVAIVVRNTPARDGADQAFATNMTISDAIARLRWIADDAERRLK